MSVLILKDVANVENNLLSEPVLAVLQKRQSGLNVSLKLGYTKC